MDRIFKRKSPDKDAFFGTRQLTQTERDNAVHEQPPPPLHPVLGTCARRSASLGGPADPRPCQRPGGFPERVRLNPQGIHTKTTISRLQPHRAGGRSCSSTS